MIFISAASSASAIPDWLAISGAVVGLVGGAGGAIVSVINVRNARETLNETRMLPVRQKQHDLIDGLVRQLPELLSALEAVNHAVQQTYGGDATRGWMETVDLVTRQITAPEVTDPELRRRMAKLHDAVLGNPHTGLGSNLIERLNGYAGLQDRLETARDAVTQQTAPVDSIVGLADQRGRDVEPLRLRIGEAIAAAQLLLERLREIQRSGLGEIVGR